MRGQRSTSRRRRATTSREAEVVGDNSKIGVIRSREEKNDFPEIPEWQSAAADVQLRPRVDELRRGSRSAENGGIQNVWDR